MKTAAGLNFGDKSIRRGFIRKVYSILSIQLLVTGAMIAFFVFLLPKYYNDPMCHQVSIKCVYQYLLLGKNNGAIFQSETNFYRFQHQNDNDGYEADYPDTKETATFDIDKCNKR